MKDLLDRWVSPAGRLSQRAYVLTFVLPLAALVAVTWVAFFVIPQVFTAPLVYLLALGWLVLLGVGDALNIKRWHDFGNSARLYRMLRPGLVLLPIIAVGLYLFSPMAAVTTGNFGAILDVVQQQADGTYGLPSVLLFAATGAGVVANGLYLSLRAGDAGPNDYGPPPGAPNVMGASGATRPAAQASGGDPVERALAEYRARTAAPRATPASAAPAGFGRKKR